MFSLVGAMAVFFIAYRIHTVGNELAEIKDVLKSIHRSRLDLESPALAPTGEPARRDPLADPASLTPDDYAYRSNDLD